MGDFITTSDGRIAIRKSEFKMMHTGNPNALRSGYEILIFSEAKPGGYIWMYDTKEARDKAMLDIKEQLDDTEVTELQVQPPVTVRTSDLSRTSKVKSNSGEVKYE